MHNGFIKFDDIETNPTVRMKNSNLKQSWNPGEKAITEGDKDIEIYPGIENDYEALAGEVQNKYPQTLEETIITSGNVEDGLRNNGYYDVNVLRNLTAGIYNSQNTADMVKNQTLRIRDTTPPNADGTDNSGFPAELVQDIIKSNESCDGLVYTKTTEQFYKDMAGNVLNLENIVEEVDDRVMPECTNIADTVEIAGDPNTASYHPNDIQNGWGQWSHPTNDLRFEHTSEILHEAYGEKDVKNKITAYSNRSDCEVADTSYVVKIRSAVGISDLTQIPTFHVYPNPTTESIFIRWDGFPSGTTSLVMQLINLKGQIIFSQKINKAESKIYVSNYSPGLYLMNVLRNHKIVKQQKIIIQH